MTELPPAEAVVPVHDEAAAALFATLQACLGQSVPFAAIHVIDDASRRPVSLPPELEGTSVSVLRLAPNVGIAAARNAGLARARSGFVACVNVEVLPRPEWLERCVRHLVAHPSVGACFTRTDPLHHDALLTRWRVRFQELLFPTTSGPADFATGHAVLFRRAALDAVDGYDERLRRINEDSDVCHRLRDHGWDTHFLATTSCTSIQQDTLVKLARKELIRRGDDPLRPPPISGLAAASTEMLVRRLARNVFRRRLSFVPVDVAVWATSLILLAGRALSTALAAVSRIIPRSWPRHRSR